jgi:hypothetical protein
MAMQCLTTPFHLTALDMYNRPDSSNIERAGFVKREYVKSVAARMGRIAPAFGFGGLGNAYLRKKFEGIGGSAK